MITVVYAGFRMVIYFIIVNFFMWWDINVNNNRLKRDIEQKHCQIMKEINAIKRELCESNRLDKQKLEEMVKEVYQKEFDNMVNLHEKSKYYKLFEKVWSEDRSASQGDRSVSEQSEGSPTSVDSFFDNVE